MYDIANVGTFLFMLLCPTGIGCSVQWVSQRSKLKDR